MVHNGAHFTIRNVASEVEIREILLQHYRLSLSFAVLHHIAQFASLQRQEIHAARISQGDSTSSSSAYFEAIQTYAGDEDFGHDFQIERQRVISPAVLRDHSSHHIFQFRILRRRLFF